MFESSGQKACDCENEKQRYGWLDLSSDLYINIADCMKLFSWPIAGNKVKGMELQERG